MNKDLMLSDQQAQDFAQTFHQLSNNVAQALLGKESVIRLALTALFSGGHLLLEDAPGTGKTALARALSATIDATHSRIQFTPDMLPSDITGVTIYDQELKQWNFHHGPIFSSIVLADEINRASPKTQSALLEVMEESQVTVEGKTYLTPELFMVIATQNPIEQAGTYRLPEAQLDRFMMRTSVGFPQREAMVEILNGSSHPDRSQMLQPVLSEDQVLQWRQVVAQTHVDPAVLDYIAGLAEATRESEYAMLGVSTRAAISMTQAVKVWAAAQGRSFVTPEDVKALVKPVWEHRIVVDADAQFNGVSASQIINQAIQETTPPTRGAA